LVLADFPYKETGNIASLSAWGTRNWSQQGDQFNDYHNGADLVVNAETTVLAPVTGQVTKIEFRQNVYNPTQAWMYQIQIDMGNRWTVSLVLEPNFPGSDVANHNAQMAAILVSEGDTVTQGQHVATLLYSGNYCHVHYMMGYTCNQEFVSVCPYQYSTDAAKAIFHTVEGNTGTHVCCYGCA